MSKLTILFLYKSQTILAFTTTFDLLQTIPLSFVSKKIMFNLSVSFCNMGSIMDCVEVVERVELTDHLNRLSIVNYSNENNELFRF